MRVTRIKAKSLKPGDRIVLHVTRVMGMQGRKPVNAAPLMRLEYEDGTTETIREDATLNVLRDE